MSCTAHKLHRPKNLTTEFHHVIPQAWQAACPVPILPDPERIPGKGDHGPLWDARTVELCPSGHRNVHYWIVKMMRALQKAEAGDPLVGYKAVRPAFAPAEFSIAYDALTRFTGSGGSLQGLIAQHQYGMA